MDTVKLQIKNVSKTFSEKNAQVKVLEGISIDVPENHFITFLGPSGCGKTTLLRIVAGLIRPTSGSVLLDGNEITKPSTKCGLVPQAYTLFPWLNVWQNIAFGLKLERTDPDEIKSTVNEYLALIGLSEYGDSYPKDLSGGMQQRVAIARTLANEPEILLMDEPFGALDSQTRSQMQEFIQDIWEARKKTVVFVTHDIDEAILLSDKIYVLSSLPSVVHEDVEIVLARPRSAEVKVRPAFLEYKNRISNAIRLNPLVSSVCPRKATKRG
mgnify:CR=1 FL=1